MAVTTVATTEAIIFTAERFGVVVDMGAASMVVVAAAMLEVGSAAAAAVAATLEVAVAAADIGDATV